MADAKAKAGEQDQSMEEILQSIKRIIAEEGDTSLTQKPAAPTVPSPKEAKPTSFGSDVLELTDLIGEETPAAESASTQNTVSNDAFDALFHEPAPAIEPMPEVRSDFPAPDEEPSIIEDSLLSEQALEASTSALRNLANMGSSAAAPVAAVSSAVTFRSGHTVEDLVVEALKPMLKEWLDANLPGIVERKVQREVERISRELRGE